jgi:hypothetical protein
VTQVAALVFAAAFTYVVSLCAGKMLLDILRVKLYRPEQYFFGFVLGSALLSTAVFLLTAAGLAYPSVFLALGLAAVALAAWRKAYRFTGDVPPPLELGWRLGFFALYAIFAVLYLKNALLPETTADAVFYHIGMPARYLREHGFPHDVRNMMANLSEGIEMLFLFAFAFGKHSAGALVHLTYTLVLPFGILSWGRRAGIPKVGAAGGLLFFMSPVVGKLATVGYIDVAVACIVFAVFYLLEIWRGGQPDRLLVAVGLLAGFCFAAKYTAGIAVPYALGTIAFERRRWRPILLAAVCAPLTMAPYLLKNTIVTGNPLAPFFNQMIPNPALTVSLETAYSYQMRHWNGVKLSQVPLEATVRGGLLQGVVGPVFLLIPLALIALRFPAGRPLVVAAAIFTLPYFASIATRFLVPPLPFLCLALGFVFSRWNTALAGLVLIHAALSWPPVVPRYCDDCWRLVHAEWRDALRLRPEEDYLRENMIEYAMGQDIDKSVPPGQPVFAFGGFQQAYHSHEIIVGWQSAFGHRLATALETPLNDSLQPGWRYESQFPEKAVRRIRLLQLGSNSAENSRDEWSVSELRVFRGDAELPRPPQWRLRASHNPWDVQLAFDNNPVTRWSSGEPLRPGMWLEIDFGKEESIDGVVVEYTNDQSAASMRLEFENKAGQWAELGGEPNVYRRRNPPGLRAAAADVLRVNHIDWLLVQDNELIARDMARQPEQWRVRQVAREANWTLYAREGRSSESR